MINCPNCGSPDITESFHPKYNRCVVCGVLFLPVYDDPHTLYTSGAYRERKNKALELEAQRRRAAHIVEYIGNPRVLIDIGASAGMLLKAARTKGAIAYGVDIDPVFGAEMYNDLQSVPEQADCITLIHTLEHMPHPLAVLRDVYNKLNTGGRVVIEVPSQFYVSAYSFPHVVMFDDEALAWTMQAAGFEMVEMLLHGNGGVNGAKDDYYLLATGNKKG